MEKKRVKPAHRLKNYQHRDLFGEWLGYKIRKIDRKKFIARATLDIRKDHLSPAGRVHGGVVSAFLDYVCGAAVFSTMAPDDLASTVELKVNYFRPLLEGDRLTAETKVVFKGKRLCVIHGYAYKGKEAVAMVNATFNVVRA